MGATTGSSMLLVTDAGRRTGPVQMHHILLQRLESGWWESGFGQHGCADSTGVEAIAAQVRDADRNANSSTRAENLLSPFALAFDLLDIALNLARQWPIRTLTR